MPSVVALLKDRDENVRMAAIKTLESMGLGLPDFVKLRSPLSTDLTIDVRVAAARRLWMPVARSIRSSRRSRHVSDHLIPERPFPWLVKLGRPHGLRSRSLLSLPSATDMPTRVMAAVRPPLRCSDATKSRHSRINVEMQHGLVEVLQLLNGYARPGRWPLDMTDKLARRQHVPRREGADHRTARRLGAPATAAVPVLRRRPIDRDAAQAGIDCRSPGKNRFASNIALMGQFGGGFDDASRIKPG